MSDNTEFMEVQCRNLYGWARIEGWDEVEIIRVYDDWLKIRADEGYIEEDYHIMWGDHSTLFIEFQPTDDGALYRIMYVFHYLFDSWRKSGCVSDYDRAMKGI